MALEAHGDRGRPLTEGEAVALSKARAENPSWSIVPVTRRDYGVVVMASRSGCVPVLYLIRSDGRVSPEKHVL